MNIQPAELWGWKERARNTCPAPMGWPGQALEQINPFLGGGGGLGGQGGRESRTQGLCGPVPAQP